MLLSFPCQGSIAGALIPRTVTFVQNMVAQIFLCLFTGFYGVLKLKVAAQEIAFPIETDGRFPLFIVGQPLHAACAAGVVFIHAPGLYILFYHGRTALAATALSTAIAHIVGSHYGFLPAVAPAYPERAGPDVLRRAQDGQLSEPLTGQIQSFSQEMLLLIADARYYGPAARKINILRFDVQKLFLDACAGFLRLFVENLHFSRFKRRTVPIITIYCVFINFKSVPSPCLIYEIDCFNLRIRFCV